MFIQCSLLYKKSKETPMKRSEVFKNLIADVAVFLFELKRKSSNPYRRIVKSFSWTKFFKVGLNAQIPLRDSKMATQEVMECFFWFKTTAAHRIYGSSEVMSKFKFIQMTKT